MTTHGRRSIAAAAPRRSRPRGPRTTIRPAASTSRRPSGSWRAAGRQRRQQARPGRTAADQEARARLTRRCYPGQGPPQPSALLAADLEQVGGPLGAAAVERRRTAVPAAGAGDRLRLVLVLVDDVLERLDRRRGLTGGRLFTRTPARIGDFCTRDARRGATHRTRFGPFPPGRGPPDVPAFSRPAGSRSSRTRSSAVTGFLTSPSVPRYVIEAVHPSRSIAPRPRASWIGPDHVAIVAARIAAWAARCDASSGTAAIAASSPTVGFALISPSPGASRRRTRRSRRAWRRASSCRR